ncbi:helix-turn-helix domain-containing protein [Streptomyces sp. NPDC002962]|uniref:helix-turn-helix domain-containing protein n=1 Tax=Streptomyces sp. NPDC002962 TaxID=3364674 RepID=UPI0036C66C85
MTATFSPRKFRQARARAEDDRGITDTQLARLTGAKRSEILLYAQGRRVPDPVRIKALADALGVRPVDLSAGSRNGWTLAELRRASGWTARLLARDLKVSERSYLRLEHDGLPPARLRHVLHLLPALLGITDAELHRHLDRSPGTRRRHSEARPLLAQLIDRHLHPGCLEEPAAGADEIAALAALYHCSAPAMASILTREITALRQMHHRRALARASADFAPARHEQDHALAQFTAENRRIAQRRTSLPSRLDAFFRQMLSQDAWHTLLLLHQVPKPRLWRSRRELPLTDAGLNGLPARFSEQQSALAGHAPRYRITAEGRLHCTQYGDWYDACYPNIAACAAAGLALLTGHLPPATLTGMLQACDTLLLSFDALLCRLFADDLGTVSDQLLHAARDLGLAVPAHRPPDPVGVFRALLRQASPAQAKPLDHLLASAEIKAASQAPASTGIARLLPGLTRGPWRLAIVTDHSAAAVDTFLARLPLPATTRTRITVIGRSADPPRTKPHPHTLHQALLHLDASPDTTLLIGGSLLDALAAQSARIPFIGVTTRPKTLREAGVAHVVPSWRTVVQALAEPSRRLRPTPPRPLTAPADLTAPPTPTEPDSQSAPPTESAPRRRHRVPPL